MKKRILYFIFLLSFLSIAIYSQAPIDIFDPIYGDISLWEKTGLINDAPSIRPYPLQEIKRILDIVIERGTENQKKKAEQYKKRLFGRIFHFGGMTEFNIKAPGWQKDFAFAPLLELNFSLNEIFTASAHVNFSLLNKVPKNETLPAFQFSKKDIMPDNSEVGSFTLLPMFNSGVAIGTSEYYLAAGMSRAAFGPFDENNIIIGEQAFHAGQFIFVINKDKFTYNQIFSAISASNDFGSNYFPQKFLAGHSVSFRPLPWISIGLLDLIMYGGRFEPIYFIPLSAFFLGQSIYRFPDNSLLGLTFGIKPVKGLKIDFVLLADDLGFNEIIKFKSARWRIASQLGISYAMPKDHWFTFVDANYTFIAPYCYTHAHHENYKNPNYENYTHNGSPLGSNLHPNSDRIHVKTQFRPIEGVFINLYNTFIRHANITESVTDPIILKEYLTKNYSTDGSVFNHPTVIKDEWHHAFLYSTPFLTQKTIQYVNQLGLEGVVNLPILKSGGSMQFKIGYTFEANINPGVNRHIYNRKVAPSNLSTEAQIMEEAEKQLKDWREKAKGKEFNHYFNIGVKISY
ncbi:MULTISPECIES: hypothetical protein [unclassified Treponema]|uniref:hypothetical protein n=1 Tax=unclassified Treponema TaxID=2638727 RepID=UPI0020A5C024|nr:MULTISPECIES: hypothetical protein [unclassified Treponema]UTC65859.1 hypothetical protein E4O06_07380 [Treponema sp. OMZ 789]UTC68587.1 hypothetical protein E4O01_07520 [Treponema sp. OMZ 790]UTC71317.1 hypothetical protein E4O02_07715 [Treponema sp. OMZ 791]